jgi:hypothetical protein
MNIIDRLRYKFRHPDVIIDDHVVFLGCSYVWGQGLEDSETVVHQFSQITSLKSANLGIRGGSASLIAEIINSGCLARARAVIISWPHRNRRHLWAGPELVCLGPWSFTRTPAQPLSLKDQEWREILRDWQEDLALARTEHQDPLYRSSAWSLTQPRAEFSYWDTLRAWGCEDRARDGLHPGAESNQRMASWLASWAQQRIIL